MEKIKAIVIGASAGGLKALSVLFSSLPPQLNLPILIVQHLIADSDNSWIRYVSNDCPLFIKEAEDKDPILPGNIYIAPADYHMLVDYDHSIALSKDEKVKFSRPSIDVLFESAADVYGASLVGIVLTGLNDDGTNGLKKIKESGGLAIVQNPKEAEYSQMPEAAIKAVKTDYILNLSEIAGFFHSTK